MNELDQGRDDDEPDVRGPGREHRLDPALGSGEAATDSISLSFSKVKWTYTDAAGGVTSGWDIAANKQIP
jgi:type VI protein secretion system component Hcp